MAKKFTAKQTKAITSTLQRYQFLNIELAFDAFSQGHTQITMNFIHDELWKERRDTLTQSILKDLQRLMASASVDAESLDTTGIMP